MYHKVIIVGNLGRDPEMRFIPSGQAVTTFSVAVSDGFGDRKKTIWFRVSAWEKQAETCNNFLKKGSKVLVEGRINADDSGNPRTWSRQDGSTGTSYELTAQTVRFLSSRNEATAETSAADGGYPDLPIDEDEIPF
ncbi:MAG: single-stranded DNA-binding protein [Anaerolineaceae bacterium]|nr:single-stranded DNA-binding protein [Anaerolineaceae bacterium]